MKKPVGAMISGAIVLVLAACAPTLLMYVREEATFIRTGVPTAATWESIVR